MGMTHPRLAVLACAASAVLACSSSDGPTGGDWNELSLRAPVWAVAPARAEEFSAAYPFRISSGIDSVERRIVRDADAWAELWRRLGSHLRPGPPPPPPVDFATEMVLFASQGTQRSGGFEIVIRRVTTPGGTLDVMVESITPGNCGTTLALTFPTHAVIVPRTDLQVRFLERTRHRQCD